MIHKFPSLLRITFLAFSRTLELDLGSTSILQSVDQYKELEQVRTMIQFIYPHIYEKCFQNRKSMERLHSGQVRSMAADGGKLNPTSPQMPVQKHQTNSLNFHFPLFKIPINNGIYSMAIVWLLNEIFLLCIRVPQKHASTITLATSFKRCSEASYKVPLLQA